VSRGLSAISEFLVLLYAVMLAALLRARDTLSE